MSQSLNRRDFLRRAAAVIPAMHAAPVLAISMDDPPKSAATAPAVTARFARLRLQSATPLTEMKAFYRDVLHLRVEESRELLRIVAGATSIEFAPVPPRESLTNPYYHFAFNIPHNKLDAAIRWLEPRCPLAQLGSGDFVAHFEAWNADAVYFLDPAGNILEFIARHTLKNDAPADRDFSERDILCASEIGVVAPDVVAASDKLCESSGLTRYRSGSPEFTAVGDEHGLFIVVKTGRKWFSSDRAAEVFEAEAHLRDELKLKRSIQLESSKFTLDRAK